MDRLKIIFNKETKKVPLRAMKDYFSIKSFIKLQGFPNQDIPVKFNLYYLDKEGDLLSITNNDELQAEIMQFMQYYGASGESMKLILAKDAIEAA